MRAILLVLGLTAARLLAAGTTSAPASTEGDRVRWREVRGQVTEELRTKDLVELALQIDRDPPASDLHAILRALDIVVRSGLTERALSLIDTLTTIGPRPSWETLDEMAYTLGSRQLAGRMYERSPQIERLNINVNNLIRSWQKSGSRPEEIDHWMAARYAANPTAWVAIWVDFRRERGTLDALIADLKRDLLADPTNGRKATAYLTARARSGGGEDDVDWMVRTCKPDTAFDACDLGRRFVGMGRFAAAIVFLERSLALPLTPEDRWRLEAAYEAEQLVRERTPEETDLRVRTKRALVKCYLGLHRDTDVRRLTAELGPIPTGSRPARKTTTTDGVAASQDATTSVHQPGSAPAEAAGFAKYWLDLAGRQGAEKQAKEALGSLAKALSVAPFEPIRGFKGNERIRTQVLDLYVDTLVAENQTDEAIQLLREEMRIAPPDSDSVWCAVGHLTWGRLSRTADSDDRELKGLAPDDPAFWAFLRRCARWTTNHSSLIEWMIHRTEPVGREALVDRLESLTRDADPTRAAVLGFSLRQNRLNARAIPLLKRAIAGIAPWGPREIEQVRSRATDALFEACVETDDWRNGESVYTSIVQKTDEEAMSRGYARLAVAAARAGDSSDALRLWQAGANLNLVRSVTRPEFAEMIRAGAGESLQVYYAGIRDRLPGSEVPRIAMGTLHDANSGH